MPAVRPRVAVTLDPEAYEAVRYLALASETSMSKIIAEIVHTIAPVFSRTADVVAAAKRAQDEQRKGLHLAALEAEERLKPLALQVAMAMDQTLDELSAASGQRAPKRAAAAAARPPISNTGVRSPEGRGKRRTRKQARR